jgi:hypothetical protein
VLSVLPGAVQRVDDPDPVGLQPARVVDRFLAEHDVAGAVGGQGSEDRALGGGVTGVAERAAGEFASAAELEEDVGRRACRPPGHPDIVDRHRGS